MTLSHFMLSVALVLQVWVLYAIYLVPREVAAMQLANQALFRKLEEKMQEVVNGQAAGAGAIQALGAHFAEKNTAPARRPAVERPKQARSMAQAEAMAEEELRQGER